MGLSFQLPFILDHAFSSFPFVSFRAVLLFCQDTLSFFA
jgi:hypothetical protein